jgi:hypothetical protein
MDRWLFFILLASFVFVITYDPRKGTLHQEFYTSSEQASSCCADPAENPSRCMNPHYVGVQFADPNYECPPETPVVRDGAIIKQ